MPRRIAEVVPGALPAARLDHAQTGELCALGLVPQARVGDWVLVRRGLAIELLDGESAAASLAALAEIGWTQSRESLVDPEAEGPSIDRTWPPGRET